MRAVLKGCCDLGSDAGASGQDSGGAVSGWGRLGRRAASGAAFVGALLLPKCPLCVAAWAAAAGIGAAGSHFLAQAADPRVRPFLLAVLILPLLLQVGLGARALVRRRRARRIGLVSSHLDTAVSAHGAHSCASGD